MSDPLIRFDRPKERPRNLRRAWLVWIAIFGGVILLMLFRNSLEPKEESIGQHQLEQLVDAGYVVKGTVLYDPQSPLVEVVGRYYQIRNGTKVEMPFRARVRLTGSLEEKLFQLPQFEARQPNTVLTMKAFDVTHVANSSCRQRQSLRRSQAD